ncbi:MAG: hypothetical protein GY702_26850 [Desulfobulbaceae bacterium]|nr:hypothetical protein [Desulfobulbaceae bacterium]
MVLGMVMAIGGGDVEGGLLRVRLAGVDGVRAHRGGLVTFTTTRIHVTMCLVDFCMSVLIVGGIILK